MKRALAAGLVGIAIVAAWVWRQGGAGEHLSAPEATVGARKLEAPLRAEHELSTMQTLLAAPIADAKGNLSISGRVTGELGPVSGATVVVTQGAGEDVLSSRNCECDNKCGRKLLECGCGEAAGQIQEFLSMRVGEAPPMGRAQTDAQGRFEITGLAQGTYALWAEGGDAGCGVLLQASAGATNVEVVLAKGRYVSGKVTGDDEKPVSGALVTAVFVSNSRFFEAITNVEGTFKIGPVPKGDYSVVASKAALLPDHSKSADEKDDVKLELYSPRKLAGRVLRQDQPVAGARVALEGQHRKLHITTGKDGRFAFEGLRPGRYELTATAEGQLASDEHELGPGKDVTDAQLVLEDAAELRGRVVDEAGAPIADAEINAYSTRPYINKETRTDANGNYSLFLSPGKYRIRASADGYFDPASKESYSEVERELAGRFSSAIDFSLGKGEVISGNVVDPHGAPVKKVSIHAYATTRLEGDDDRSWAASAYSKEDGSFELKGLSPGRYRITATHAEYEELELEAETGSGKLHIALSKGAAIHGRVVDENGVPQVKASLTVLPDSDRPLTEFSSREKKWAETNEKGEFKLEGLAGGRYQLLALVGERTRDATYRTASKAVEVAHGATLRVEIALEKGLSISGRVVDAQQRPISETEVIARPKLSEGMVLKARAADAFRMYGSKAKADANGLFTLTHLPAGEYLVYAIKEGFQPPKEEPSPVSAGTRNLTIVLEPLGMLTGRVVDESGNPVSEFRVNWRDHKASDGTFSLPIHQTGVETITVSADRLAPVTREIKVALGQSQKLDDFILTRGRTVQLTAVDAASGKPVAGAEVDWRGQFERRGKPSRTNSAGTVLLEDLPVSATEILVRGERYIPQQVMLPEAVTTFTTRLSMGATISGTAFDAEGRGLGGVDITAQRKRTPALDKSSVPTYARATSNKDGVFELAGLSSGEFALSAEYKGDYGRYADQVIRITGAETVVVELRPRTGGITVELRIVDVNGAEVFAMAGIGPGELPPLERSEQWEDLAPKLIAPKNLMRGAPIFEHIPAGRATLFVMRREAKGYAIHRQFLDVPSNGPFRLEVRLPAQLPVIALGED